MTELTDLIDFTDFTDFTSFILYYTVFYTGLYCQDQGGSGWVRVGSGWVMVGPIPPPLGTPLIPPGGTRPYDTRAARGRERGVGLKKWSK